MHRVRAWAHRSAHESKFNPWSGPQQNIAATGTTTSAPNRDDAENNAVEIEPTKARVPVWRRCWLNTKKILFRSWINILLVFVPVGIAVHFAGVNPIVVFALNAVAIIPLAGLLTFATESVAHRLGPTLGALMNVSFGNAVELIIFIIALVKNEIRIVQASLIGSILANLLLILGMAFLIGGLEYREQIYDSTVTQMSACLLALAVLGVLIPSAFHASFNDLNLADAAVLKVSRGTSVILLLTYLLYLLFQLKSHAYLYQGTPQYIIEEQTEPGFLARFDTSSSSASDGTSSSIRTTSSGGSHRRVRRRIRAKLGMKRHVKKEVIDENESSEGPSRRPTMILEEGEVLSPVASPESVEDVRPLSSENTERNTSRPLVGHEVLNEKNVQDSSTAATQATLLSHQQAHSVSPAQAPTRPGAVALRSFSFRPRAPPVFRNNTTQPSPMVYPNTPPALRRGRSAPNTSQLAQPSTKNTMLAAPGTPAHTNSNPTTVSSQPKDSSEDDEPPISQPTAIVLLVISTVLVALCAEFLVGSIEYMVASTPLSEAFIGLIILPIVGNAAEHVTAVTVAAKNKLDLALGVSLGSSIQIALFVTPVVVILGWILDKSMTLYFNLFETASLFVSTFIVNFLVLDGRSNYLEGALLCACYVILAVGAFFFPDDQAQSALTGGGGGSGS